VAANSDKTFYIEMKKCIIFFSKKLRISFFKGSAREVRVELIALSKLARKRILRKTKKSVNSPGCCFFKTT